MHVDVAAGVRDAQGPERGLVHELAQALALVLGEGQILQHAGEEQV